MKKRLVVLFCGFVLVTVAASVAMVALDTKSEHGKPEPAMAGVHWAKGQKPTGGPSHASPNLSSHGGNIMVSVQATAIFWGKGWQNSTGDKISGIDSFYAGIGGSNFATTSDEYYDASGAVTPAIGYSGHLLDTSTTATNGSNTAPILAEVCKVIGKTAVANGYYPVYVDIGRGHASFCAWHSAGTCGGVPVQFAFFFDLDGDMGCDPTDQMTGHSQGLAALANVSGHEISEARSDPRLNAWYDSSGGENADKCAWVFHNNFLPFKNGTQWKIQGNWSNAAYNAGTGYANSSGQKGCIDGGVSQ